MSIVASQFFHRRKFVRDGGRVADLAYRTRGGLSIGAIYANRRWAAALRLDRFDPKTAISLDATDLENLRVLLVKAKESLH
jgi:hypothetical protein